MATEVLTALAIPYRASELAEIARQEYDLAFVLAPRWPDHFSPIQLEATQLVDKQVEALRNVLAEYEVQVDPFATDVAGLAELPAPVVLILRDAVAGSSRLVVFRRTSNRNQAVQFSFPGGREVTQPIEAFLTQWSGFALAFRRIEPRDAAVLSRPRVALSQRYVCFFLLCVALAVAGAAICRTEPVSVAAFGGAVAFALLKAAGTLVCLAILRTERRHTTKATALQQLCTLHRSFSCDRVLASKGSKLFGVVRLSDIGLVYFVAGAAFLILAVAVSRTQEAITLFGFLAVGALPFTCYSVVYQAAIVRAWCPLCLAVQLILWLEAGVAAWAWNVGYLTWPTPGAAALGTAAVTATAFAVIREREHDKTQKRARRAQARLSVLQRNPVALVALLRGGPGVDVPELPSDLVIGSDDASVRIVALLDPQCHRCAVCFSDLRRLTKSLPDLFQVRIRLVSDLTPLRTAEDVVTLVETDMHAAESFLASWYRYVLHLLHTEQIAGSGDVTQAIYARWRKCATAEHGLATPRAGSRSLRRQLQW